MTATIARLNRGYGTLRCVEPQDFCECGESRLHAERHERSGCKLGFVGCGWSGPSAWVKTFGMTVWEVEECPECLGAVEADG